MMKPHPHPQRWINRDRCFHFCRALSRLAGLGCATTMLALTPATASTCPDGSQKPLSQPSYRFGDYFYRLTPCQGSWADTQAEAQRQGGNLSSILSIAENQWLLSKFGRPELGKLLWIGLNAGSWVDGAGVPGSIASPFYNVYPMAVGTSACSGSVQGTMSTFSGGWVTQSPSCPAPQSTKYGIVKVAASAACVLDADSDGTLNVTIDGLVLMRILAGFDGAAIGEGLSPAGSEATGATIGNYLRGVRPLSAFGSAIVVPSARVPKATNDGLVLLRLLRGMSDAQLLTGIAVPAGALNVNAAQIRSSINARCGADF